MISLQNRHYFIFGGSRGIGAATACLIAQAGGRVSIGYRAGADAAARVVADIRQQGGQAAAYAGDIAEEGVATRLVADAVAAQGELHGIVIAAGIFEPGPIDTMTAAFWDRTMAVNVRGTFLAVQAAVPSLRRAALREACSGSVVVYTSTAGQRGSAVYSAYATSKAAQILFTRSMALELAPDRIRCNCVAPAWTDTDMASTALSAEDKIAVGARVPLGRIGKPEEPAAAALFLLSDLAGFITGSTITVDGGADMRG